MIEKPNPTSKSPLPSFPPSLPLCLCKESKWIWVPNVSVTVLGLPPYLYLSLSLSVSVQIGKIRLGVSHKTQATVMNQF
jgi:hypothetical protein